jgi:hypothetical protein
MAPGPELAHLLADIDRDRLSGHDRVELLRASARMVAHFQAVLYADIQSVSEAIEKLWDGEDDSESVFHAASSEVQTALTLTRRSGEAQVDLAAQLRLRIPRVWQALHDGRIDLARARVICEQTSHLSLEVARGVADAALVRAPGQTTGQLRASLHRLVIASDPALATQRYGQALGHRRVLVEAGLDGTANLMGLDLPPDEANAAMRRINRLARCAKNRGDRRGIDQIRAGVFLDLLLGQRLARNQQVGGGGVIDLRVDLTTLAGLNNNPA